MAHVTRTQSRFSAVVEKTAGQFNDTQTAEMFALLCRSMDSADMAQIIADTFGHDDAPGFCQQIRDCIPYEPR